MRRTWVVLARKVSVVVLSVMILYWLILIGGLIFLGATEGKVWVIRFLRDAGGAMPTGPWDPTRGAMKLVTILLVTVVRGIVAVRSRKRIESL
jgi:hypothetical protein